ncbi:UDP-N-acetylmuramoyl-tripeptide--D-alanyl-D-alanine ligase [Egibacter rhizosphaerae]|uniref:UDP-N-acetylmuramoyl-tripeptide--D-alanyl-D-alanine ligase n=1 Tax=Egibacter rhizosphaerae TaxID=1670831 RepID=A0A411YAB2_9ACTN|nr:UDP-N-acetylmuramoyl-tripeptide--D-alanyl-D-alanine ligase [Egibacter rhizosphaerae]QBI18135.1 UDP-N-acetylmuramoyl-tripeptide--D-alanyl-D-alanine ligase [Egibacter rhizosphaerae]
MIPLSLAAVADVVGGELRADTTPDGIVRSVSIDSRSVETGALFVPLSGERTDGHRFIEDALARGATGYLVAADRPEAGVGPPGAIVVDEPQDALLGLGRWVRDEVAPVVIAITGSTGKTSTKDLIAAACREVRPTVANPGSYNNELGVPLTCCALEADSEVLVAEIGARGLGHIAKLAAVLRPDVAVVTSVGAAHLELLGDLATVARAKGELVESLGPEGVAILNADDERVAAMRDRSPGAVVTYAGGGAASADGLDATDGTGSPGASADWRAVDVRLDERACPSFTARFDDSEVEVHVPASGRHHVGNALAALAAAHAAGVDPSIGAAGLASARLSPWRSELTGGDGRPLVLNDAYNANPTSMRAALETLAALPGEHRWAVLGLMAELGEGERAAHEEIGHRCATLGLDGLVVVGADAAAIAAGAEQAGFAGEGGVTLVPDPDAAREVLERVLDAHDAVLVKASRAVGLERLAADLVGEGAGP